VHFDTGANGKRASRSNGAYVGNFAFTSLAGNDPTMPAAYSHNNRHDHSFAGYDRGDYEKAKLNMSVADAYPASVSFRSPLQGDSSAPNVRSALFIMPAWRVGQISVTKQHGDLNVPLVTDFNNYANNAFDSDHNPNNGFRWDNPTGDQMLSSRDFATLVAHYRLRGADALHLFETGVVGKTQDQLQNEAREGWTEPNLSARMSASDRTLLIKDGPGGQGVPSLGDNSSIVVDGKTKSIEDAGAMWSGVYSLSQGKLDVLLSNMDDAGHKITLPSTVGGYAVNTKDFAMGGGQHLLVEYNLASSGSNKGWNIALAHVPFTDLDDHRDHPGVPEPTIVSLLGIVGMCGLVRRRRGKIT
jgi:hypothetical protein